MNQILYVQPIFAPDKKRAMRNVESLKSFGNYIRANGTDGIKVTMVVGGWAKTDELWNMIDEALKQIDPKYIGLRFDKNYGKAVAVNKLIAIANQNGYQWSAILTADSDILFPLDNKRMFGRLITASQHSSKTKGKPFGMISLNQRDANCHWKCCYENELKYSVQTPTETFNERLVWPHGPSGIAGGCIFVGRQAWEAVGGYKVFGCYGGDDAVLLLEIGRSGFTYDMFDNLSIIHPSENDEEYAKWKHSVCLRDTLTGPKTNIDSMIKEADEFWNKHAKD